MTDSADSSATKPGGGKTFGVFALTYALSFVGCTVTAMLASSTVGLNIYVSGGLLFVVLGAVCAAVYRRGVSAGKLAIASVVIGIAVGGVLVLAFAALSSEARPESPSTSSASAPSSERSQAPEHEALSPEETIAMCTTEEARSLISRGRTGSSYNWDLTDPAMQRITFGGIETTNYYNSKNEPYWQIGEYETAITSEQAAQEVIEAAISQMCGSAGGAKGAFVRRAYENPALEAQIAQQRERRGVVGPLDVSMDVYEIDGTRWFACTYVVEDVTQGVVRYVISIRGGNALEQYQNYL